jgi:hypothetical protein
MTYLRHAVTALGLLLFGACAWRPAWDLQGGGSVLTTADGRYRTRIPEGLEPCSVAFDEVELCGPVPVNRSWFELPQPPEYVRMPDVIHIESLPARDFLTELGFHADADVTPFALAERWIAAKRTAERSYGSYLRLDPPEIDVLAQEPATIAGVPAFRLHWTEREANGLRVEHLTYGVRLDERVFLFERRAPALVYFERFVPAFEQLVAGFGPVARDAAGR